MKFLIVLYSVFISVKGNCQSLKFCDETVPTDNNYVFSQLNNMVKSYRTKGWWVDVLRKQQLYAPIITQILREEEVPDDLKYLPVVESAYNSNVVSSVGARGMWQFMPRTAVDYKLEVSAESDERINFIKSTHAAARYLRDLHKKYASWHLAVAAYNCGSGNLDKAIKRSGTLNYYGLAINAETATYIYRIVAMKLLFEQNIIKPIEKKVKKNSPAMAINGFHSWTYFDDSSKNAADSGKINTVIATGWTAP